MSEIPTRQEIDKSLDDLLGPNLSRRVEGGVDWPEISDEDWKLLSNLFNTIINAKFGHDCDGYSPIWWRMIQRSQNYYPAFQPMPSGGNYNDTEKLLKSQSVALHNLQIAMRELEMATRILSHAEDQPISSSLLKEKIKELKENATSFRNNEWGSANEQRAIGIEFAVSTIESAIEKK